MSWKVWIEGNPENIDNIARIYSNNQEFKILNHEKEYYLYLGLFEEIDKSEIVRDVAQNFLDLLNAIYKMDTFSNPRLRIKSIIFIDDKGTEKSYVTKSLTGSYSILKAPINIGRIDPFKCFKLRQYNEKVDHILIIIDHQFSSWFGLYKILDIIIEDKFLPVHKGGLLFRRCRRFKQTAQSYDAVGLLEARHGKKSPPPPNPMTISEAQNLIGEIVFLWLEEKIRDI